MLSCIKLFFNKNKLFKNLANYMLIILLILSVISILVFSFYDCKKIKKFFDIIIKINRFKLENENIKTTNIDKKTNMNINENINIDKNKIQLNIKIKNKEQKKSKMKIKKKIRIRNKNESKNQINSENNSEILFDKKAILKDENLKLEEFNNIELNDLSYRIALIKDKRTFLQLYWSLIKTKHILFFSFFHLNDFNSQMIKIFIFFFTFAMNLVVSAMFYSDSTMHKIYIDDGSFDLAYQLPQMIYSLIISTILENLLNLLGLYEKDIIEFKNSKIMYNNKIFVRIKIKIVVFFIVIHILLILFWIYLGCFCTVYKNTQIHLLLDVLYSFGLSLITPFFVVLFPCIFRILSLRDKNGKRPIFYKVSIFLLNF